jgi:hypothetical protein
VAQDIEGDHSINKAINGLGLRGHSSMWILTFPIAVV